jgi:hypothetical protein
MNGKEQANHLAQKIQLALDHKHLYPDFNRSLIRKDGAFLFLYVTDSHCQCYCIQEGNDESNRIQKVM